MSATNLGDELWYGRRTHSNCSCPFARPAGAVLSKLRALGLTELVPAEDRTDLHGLTVFGQTYAA